jgi:hypothetical protein
MIKPITDLEVLLGNLIVEHRRLLKQVDAQQTAMKAMDLAAIDAAIAEQDVLRRRIATLERRRGELAAQAGILLRLNGPVTLLRLAEALPAQCRTLLKLRAELRDLMSEIQQRASIAARVAGSVLGHLNTAMRILAGAVERAGVYTRSGVPRMSTRVGVMDAIG